MKAWQIFMHSVRQVTGNFEAALRISAVLYLAQILLEFVLAPDILSLSDEERRAMMMAGTFPTARFCSFLLVSGFIGLWMTVGWHRFVLTNEVAGIIPRIHVDRIFGYFGKSVLMAFILMVPALGFILTLGLALPALFGSNIIPFLPFLVAIPLSIIAIRLFTALPGAALQPGVPVLSGWHATKGETWTIVQIVLIFVPITLLFSGVQMVLSGIGLGAGILWGIVAGLPLWLLGVSVLTTLYGHYIEKRSLS